MAGSQQRQRVVFPQCFIQPAEEPQPCLIALSNSPEFPLCRFVGDRGVRWRIMNGDISIDVGSAVPYLTDRVLSLFHKDLASQEWQAQIRTLVRSSFER